MRPRFWFLAALACGTATSGAAAAGREDLHWNAFAVDAFLDAEGALHVSERHTIVFTGNWNGAERVFGLRSGQSLVIERVSRIDSGGGALRPLTAGDVDRVDHYEYSPSSGTLRWRSRLPGDPVFAQTEIVYVIDYVLYGVFRSTGGSLRIAHDLGFGRAGEIETVSAQLRAASGWRPRAPLALAFVRRNLPANEPVIIDASFDTPSRFMRRLAAMLALLIVAPLLFVRALLAYERRRGRLAPIAPPDEHDLEQQLLHFKPELVAVLWDAWDKPGRNAVAALLARMVLEDKVSLSTADGQLLLELRIERERLEGYERELVDGLFFAGDTTCARALQSHYRRSGFCPRAYLSSLMAEREALVGPVQLRWVLGGLALAMLFGGAIASLAAPGEAALRTAVTCAASSLPALVGVAMAARWRSRLDFNADFAADFIIPALILPLGAAEYAWLDSGVLILAELGVALITLAFCAGVLAFAAGTETRDGLALRRRLAGFRIALARALRSRRPLPNSIAPYVIAFDLVEHTDAASLSHAWGAELRSIAAGVATPWAHRESQSAW